MGAGRKRHGDAIDSAHCCGQEIVWLSFFFLLPYRCRNTKHKASEGQLNGAWGNTYSGALLSAAAS